MSRYIDEINYIYEDARHECINILVWGPGIPSSGVAENKRYQKRVQIKDELKRLFHRSEVHFSEDKELDEVTEHIHGQLNKEAIHAAASDLVIILGISRGADLEIDHFVKVYPWFRDKVYIYLPEEYVNKDSLVGSEILDLLSTGRVIGYSEKEFQDCTVATIKAVQAADTIAVAKRLSRQ